MEISYPALTTASLFAALILLDLGKHQYKLMVGHFLFSFIAVLLMIYLSENDLDFVAWGIFAIPFILLMTGLIIGVVNAAPGSGSPPPPPSTQDKDSHSKTANHCDASGNVVGTMTISGLVSSLMSTKNTQAGQANTLVTSQPTVPCGSGKTQCIDTSKLSSA
jgi:uncharacterized integral membrane protein